MASSYTTNLGIESITTGEQSGAWGTTSNYNWDIIDRIRGYKSVAITGTSHTLLVQASSPVDGADHTEDGNYPVIKFTGSSGDPTVTISPNTANTSYIFINGTGNTITFTQGSGGNVSLQNGKAAQFYFDGAGAGAEAVRGLDNLEIATLECTGNAAVDGTLTVTGATTLSTVLGIASGGTGLTSFTAGDLMYATASTTIAKLGIGTAGQFLKTNTGASAPEWSTETDLCPVGSIVMYGAAAAPTNWLLCDGSAVNRTTYADLFTAIGTSYGAGNGSSTFNVPNLQSKFPIGYDGGSSYDIAGTGGAATDTPTLSGTNAGTTLTSSQIPAHTHGGVTTGWPSGSWTGGTGATQSAIDASGLSLASGSVNLSLENTGGGSSHTHTWTGTSTAVDTIPPYLVVNFIIKT
jgi:microcystin-dependent protein